MCFWGSQRDQVKYCSQTSKEGISIMILVLDNNRNHFLLRSQRGSLILMDDGERRLKEIVSPSHTEGRLVWTAWNLYNLLSVTAETLLAFYCLRWSESSQERGESCPLHQLLTVRGSLAANHPIWATSYNSRQERGRGELTSLSSQVVVLLLWSSRF